MPAKPAGGSVIRLAMEDLLEKDRKEYWREEIGRNVIAVDYEQLSDIPLNCSIEIRRLPGLSIVTSFSDGHRIVRTSRHIASEDDQLVLGIMSEGSAHATQLGHDAAVFDCCAERPRTDPVVWVQSGASSVRISMRAVSVCAHGNICRSQLERADNRSRLTGKLESK